MGASIYKKKSITWLKLPAARLGRRLLKHQERVKHVSIKRSAVHTLALLAAAILGVVLLVGAIHKDIGFVQMAAVLAVLAIGLFALALATAFTTKERLFMAVIYILIACTFLNNAFFAIHLGFFSLFLYRLLLIAAGCLHIIGMVRNRTHIERWNGLQVKGILLFFAFWFIYGLVSLLWAKSVTAGLKYLALLAMGIFFIYLIVMYVQKIERLMIVYAIWLVMTVFLMIIGFYNHITHHHLASSTLYSGRSISSIIRHQSFLIKMTLRPFYRSASFLHHDDEKQ